MNGLVALGFNSHFSRQLSPEEFESGLCVRVIEVQRGCLTVTDGKRDWSVSTSRAMTDGAAEDCPTVGDWLVLGGAGDKVERLLERTSLFRRVAAGTRVDVQLIAANIDTLFIVSSCSHEFKESRLERYLALAMEAGVYPVVLLTKADVADDPESYRRRAESVRSGMPVEVVNALNARTLEGATAWIGPGQTVALVGSSGVGKSTLVNTLAGDDITATGGIREKYAKGRHTTSARTLHRLASGGLLLDVPGMRELKVANVGGVLDDLFDDVAELACDCRFGDCTHGGEPGCAVLAAIDTGRLEQRRLDNYLKLIREEARHNESLHERRERERRFGKVVKQANSMKRSDGNQTASAFLRRH